MLQVILSDSFIWKISLHSTAYYIQILTIIISARATLLVRNKRPKRVVNVRRQYLTRSAFWSLKPGMHRWIVLSTYQLLSIGNKNDLIVWYNKAKALKNHHYKFLSAETAERKTNAYCMKVSEASVKISNGICSQRLFIHVKSFPCLLELFIHGE